MSQALIVSRLGAVQASNPAPTYPLAVVEAVAVAVVVAVAVAVAVAVDVVAVIEVVDVVDVVEAVETLGEDPGAAVNESTIWFAVLRSEPQVAVTTTPRLGNLAVRLRDTPTEPATNAL